MFQTDRPVVLGAHIWRHKAADTSLLLAITPALTTSSTWFFMHCFIVCHTNYAYELCYLILHLSLWSDMTFHIFFAGLSRILTALNVPGHWCPDSANISYGTHTTGAQMLCRSLTLQQIREKNVNSPAFLLAIPSLEDETTSTTLFRICGDQTATEERTPQPQRFEKSKTCLPVTKIF